MIKLNNEKIVDIIFYHIMHNSLDAKVINPILDEYEDEVDSKTFNLIHKVSSKIAEAYFKEGYLLGKSI